MLEKLDALFGRGERRLVVEVGRTVGPSGLSGDRGGAALTASKGSSQFFRRCESTGVCPLLKSVALWHPFARMIVSEKSANFSGSSFSVPPAH